MKKLMMLAALLAMVLVAAAPALAQAPSVDLGDEGDDNSSVQYGDEASATGGDQSQNAVNQCEQVLDQAVDQNNTISGDQTATATASGDGDAGAAAGNDQDNTVTAEQVQYCVNVLQGGIVADDGSIAAGGDVETDGVDNDEDGAVDEADGSEASASAAASSSAAAGSSAGSSSAGSSSAGSSSAGSSSAGELPATGGVSLLTLGAGALLVAGGLVARRIVR